MHTGNDFQWFPAVEIIDLFPLDENYGQSGIQAFRELADKNGICIAREDSVRKNWISCQWKPFNFHPFPVDFEQRRRWKVPGTDKKSSRGGKCE